MLSRKHCAECGTKCSRFRYVTLPLLLSVCLCVFAETNVPLVGSRNPEELSLQPPREELNGGEPYASQGSNTLSMPSMRTNFASTYDSSHPAKPINDNINSKASHPYPESIHVPGSAVHNTRSSSNHYKHEFENSIDPEVLEVKNVSRKVEENQTASAIIATHKASGSWPEYRWLPNITAGSKLSVSHSEASHPNYVAEGIFQRHNVVRFKSASDENKNATLQEVCKASHRESVNGVGTLLGTAGFITGFSREVTMVKRPPDNQIKSRALVNRQVTVKGSKQEAQVGII